MDKNVCEREQRREPSLVYEPEIDGRRDLALGQLLAEALGGNARANQARGHALAVEQLDRLVELLHLRLIRERGAAREDDDLLTRLYPELGAQGRVRGQRAVLGKVDSRGQVPDGHAGGHELPKRGHDDGYPLRGSEEGAIPARM